MPERPYIESIKTDLTPEFGESSWRDIQSFIDLAQNHFDALQIANEQKYSHMLGITEPYKPDDPLQMKVHFLMERLKYFPDNEDLTQNAYQQLQIVMQQAGRHCPPLAELQQKLEILPSTPPIKVKVTNGERIRLVKYEDMKDLDASWEAVGFRIYDPGNGFAKELIGYTGVTMKKNHPRTRGGIGEGMKMSVNRLLHLGIQTTFVSAHEGELWQAEAMHKDNRLQFGVVRKWKRPHPERTGSYTDVDFTQALSQDFSTSVVGRETLTKMLDALDPRQGAGLSPYLVEFNNEHFIPIPQHIDFSSIPDDQLTTYLNSIDNKFAIPQNPQDERRIFARGVFITTAVDTHTNILFDYDLPKWAIKGADRKTIRPEILRGTIRQMLMDTSNPQVIDTITQAMNNMISTEEVAQVTGSLGFGLTDDQKELWRQSFMNTYQFEIGQDLFTSGVESSEDLQLARQNNFNTKQIPANVISFLQTLYPEQVVTLEQLKSKGYHREVTTTAVAEREPVDTQTAVIVRGIQNDVFRRLLITSPTAMSEHSPRLFNLPTMKIIGSYPTAINYYGLPLSYSAVDNALVISPGAHLSQRDILLEINIAVQMINALINTNIYDTQTQQVLTELLGNTIHRANPNIQNATIPEITTDDSGLFRLDFGSREQAQIAQRLLTAGQVIAQARKVDAKLVDIQAALTALSDLIKGDLLTNPGEKGKYQGHQNLQVINVPDDSSAQFNAPYSQNDPPITPTTEYTKAIQYIEPYFYIDGQVNVAMNDLTLQQLPSQHQIITRPDQFFLDEGIDVATLKDDPELHRALLRQFMDYLTTHQSALALLKDKPLYNIAHEQKLTRIEEFLQLIEASGTTLERAYLSRFARHEIETKGYFTINDKSRLVLSPPYPDRGSRTNHINFDATEIFQGLELDMMPDNTLTLQFVAKDMPDRPITITVRKVGDTIFATQIIPGEPAKIIDRGQETHLGIGHLKLGLYGTVIRIIGQGEYDIIATPGKGELKEARAEKNEGQPVIDCKIDVTYRSQVWDDPLRSILDEYSNRKDAQPDQEPSFTFTVFNTKTMAIKRNVTATDLTQLDTNWHILQFTSSDMGPGFSTEYLTGLGDSSKGEGNIGRHGEGMKLITIAAQRAGIHMQISSQKWQAVPRQHTIQIPNTDTKQVESFDILRYEMQWQDTPRVGSQTIFSIVDPTALKLAENATQLTTTQWRLVQSSINQSAENSPTNNWRAWTNILDPRNTDTHGNAGIERYIVHTPGDGVIEVLPERPGAIYERGIFIPKDQMGTSYLFGYEVNAAIVNTRERNDYDQDKLAYFLTNHYQNLRDISLMKEILRLAVTKPNGEYREYAILEKLSNLAPDIKALWVQAFYEVFGNNAILSLQPAQVTRQQRIYQHPPSIAHNYFDTQDPTYQTLITGSVFPTSAYQHLDTAGTRNHYLRFHLPEEPEENAKIDRGVAMEIHLAATNLVKLPPELTRFMHKLGLIYSSADFANDVNATDLYIPPEDRANIEHLIQEVCRTVGKVTEHVLENDQLRTTLLAQTNESTIQKELQALQQGILGEDIHIHSRKWPPNGAVTLASDKLAMSLNAALLAEQRENLPAVVAHELCHLLFNASDYTLLFEQVMMALAMNGESLEQAN